MKVVWELENWKKAEEAKFLFSLKQKEIDYLSKLNEDWKKREHDKEKLFKNHESNIISIESRLRGKALELQKRENKLVLLETEYKAKIDETLAEVARKDEEIKFLKSGHNEAIKKFTNTNKALEKQIASLNSTLVSKDKEIINLKKEVEINPLSKLKKEIQDKSFKIDALQTEIHKYKELNDEYKDYLSTLQEEIQKLRDENESIKMKAATSATKELDSLKIQLFEITQNMKGENLHDFRKELNEIKTLRQDHLLQTKTSKENDGRHLNLAHNNELTRLISEKAYLIECGLQEDDILIKDLNDAIEKAKSD